MDNDGYRPVVFIITGDRGSGKTTALQGVVERLRDQNLKIGGIFTPGTVKNGMRHSFTVYDVMRGRGVMLSSSDAHEGWERLGSYYFNPEGMDHGLRALSSERLREADLIVIDEIGHFELAGKIWADSIDRLREETDLPMIWVVRRWIIDQVIARWGLLNPVIQDISEYGVDEIAGSVKRVLDEDDIDEM